MKNACTLIVDVLVNPCGFVDVYIDNTIGLTVDLPHSKNTTMLERAVLLAIWTAAQPKDAHEPMSQEEMAAQNKLLAEAGLEETKKILCWLFNFRSLTVSLPENKYVA